MSGALIAPPCKGIDCNEVIGPDDARRIAQAGFSFAVRYITRETLHTHDLSRSEVANLFSAGLAVMPVQHVESESAWEPTIDKGRAYGQTAADYCRSLGVPAGTSVWLDLEGIAPGTPSSQVVDYCNEWYDRLATAGYLPGVYVGWHAGLSAVELYERLKFQRYWAAYNLNTDEHPAVRGVCMTQRLMHSPIKADADMDIISADAKGGMPVLWAPDEWVAK